MVSTLPGECSSTFAPAEKCFPSVVISSPSYLSGKSSRLCRNLLISSHIVWVRMFKGRLSGSKTVVRSTFLNFRNFHPSICIFIYVPPPFSKKETQSASLAPSLSAARQGDLVTNNFGVCWLADWALNLLRFCFFLQRFRQNRLKQFFIHGMTFSQKLTVQQKSITLDPVSFLLLKAVKAKKSFALHVG